MEIFFDVWGKDVDFDTAAAIGEGFWETMVEHQTLVDGTEDVLDFCQDHDLLLGVITNGSEMMTGRRLAKGGIADYFDVVVHSEGVGAEKSQMEPFHVFLDRADKNGEECLMVGDRKDEDMHAAKVGMKTVWFHKHTGKHVGDVYEPDYEIAELTELKPVIQDLL